MLICFCFFFKQDKDVADLDELVSPHHIPAQQVRVDQGELFSNLEKELAALDENPPQQEQPEESVVTVEPEQNQHVQHQKV